MEKNILVVEDKSLHMEQACKLLQNMDVNVKIFKAFTFEEAIVIASQHRIHVFLVDIILKTSVPGDVSGMSFIQTIRNISKYAFTPVIILTSLEDPKLYAYSELHCYGYLEKPYDKEKLYSLVKSALQSPVMEGKDTLYLRNHGLIYSVSIPEIVFIEIARKGMVIHTIRDDFHFPYRSMEEMLRELESARFLPCSRFVIVNRDYVASVDYTNRMIHLKTRSEILEIGPIMLRRFKEEFEHG